MTTSKRTARKYNRIRRNEEVGLIKVTGANRQFRRFCRSTPAVFGLGVFGIIFLGSFLAPLLTKFDPATVDLSNIQNAPSIEHILGTDALGRDVFSRLLYGGRISILVGVLSSVFAAIIGIFLGCIAGYIGGILDSFLVRVSEAITSFPPLIIALLLVSIAGQSITNLVLIFSFTGWCNIFRLTRTNIMSIKEEEYIQALKAFALNDFVIMFKHALPNALSSIFVNFTLNTAAFILAEAGLSFLGLGVPMEVPTWGNLLNSAQSLEVLENAWWMWVPAGITVSLFVLSINFIGDGLRDSSDANIIL